MNREIEFRGKIKRPHGIFVSCTDKKDDEWVWGDLELRRNDGRVLIHLYDKDGCYYRQYDIDPDTVGQFTGIKDKHGKKIYEGDIVRRKDSAFGYVDTGVVKYDCHLGAFVLEYKSYGRTYQSTFKKGFSDNDGKCTIEGTYSYEVIGNVYDNPHLQEVP